MKTKERIWNFDETLTTLEFTNKNISLINRQKFISDDVNKMDNELLVLTKDLHRTIMMIKTLSKERDEAICEVHKIEITYCNNCGSRLGIDCGDAEPDYNEDFCSKGCYEEIKTK